MAQLLVQTSDVLRTRVYTVVCISGIYVTKKTLLGCQSISNLPWLIRGQVTSLNDDNEYIALSAVLLVLGERLDLYTFFQDQAVVTGHDPCVTVC